MKGLCIRPLTDPRVVERVRVLDKHTIAVKYTDSYYVKYVYFGSPFNHVAFFNDILVGSITCRLEPTDEADVSRLYIMTIAVLEPYRKLGIGSRLLQTVLNHVHNERHTQISCIALHMQVGSSVERFYKHFDFETVEVVKDYYGELEEHDALLLQRVIPQPFIQKKNGKK